MTLRKSFLYAFAITLGFLGASGVIAWTGPSTGAPGGNASAPLNISATGQTKVGGLRLNSGGAATGLEVISGISILFGGSSSNWAGLNVGGTASINAAGSIYSYSTICVANSFGTCTGVGGTILNGSGLTLSDTGGSTYDSTISHSAVSPYRFLNLTSKGGTGGWGGGINFDVNYNAGNTFTAMTIRNVIGTNTANVGIGMTAPLAKLQVNGTSVVTDPGGGQQGIFAISVGAGSAGDAKLEFGVYDTGTAGYSWLQAINASSGFRAIVLNATGGNVGIGTTAPGQKLDVNGAVQATAFYYSSDARLKKNIEAISNNKALADILALNPVTYNWKDASRGKGTQLGFIAQEVEAIAPELVSTNPETGMKSVDYARVTPLLVGALQAQQARLDAQQEQLDLLVAEVEELKADK